MILPIIRSYTNLQLRLGLLKIISLVGERRAMTKEGLASRLNSVLRQPVEEKKFCERLMQDVKERIGSNPPDQKIDDEIQKIIGDIEQSYFAMLLMDPASTVHEGFVSIENAKELIDLSQAIELVSKDYSLMENAMVLRALIGAEDAELVFSGNLKYNPIILDSHGGWKEKTFFLLLLLLHDLPMAYLPKVCIRKELLFHRYSDFESGAGGKQQVYARNNLLLQTYFMMQSECESKQIWYDLENYKEWEEYFEGKKRASGFSGLELVEEEYRMGKKASYRHHATPRLEFLVDLGLLDRPKRFEISKSEEVYWYKITEQTKRSAYCFDLYLHKDIDVGRFVRKNLFGFANYVYGIGCQNKIDAEVILKLFLKAYRKVKRDFGHTPMWSTSILACLLAQDQRLHIEIDQVYKAVEEAGHGPYRSFLNYSGGSRFDEEFLIQVDPKLYKELRIDEEEDRFD